MSFANEFILSRFVDTKGKKIEAIGERWVLIPTSILSALHSRLPEEELFNTGEKVAGEVSAKIKERLGLNNNYLLAKFAEKGMSAGGWGKLTVEDFDEKNMRGIVSCEDPPAGGHLMRGMMAGFSKTITGREMDVREVECAETSGKKIKFYVTLKEPAASPHH